MGASGEMGGKEPNVSETVEKAKSHDWIQS